MPENFWEATLESMIMDSPDVVQVRRFPQIYKVLKNQFRLPTGKICDIITFEIVDNRLSVKIFELKREELSLSALKQLMDYGETVVRYTDKQFNSVNIELYLVGYNFDAEIFTLFSWGVNVGLITYQYKADGIHFELWLPNGGLVPPAWISHADELILRPDAAEKKNFSNELRTIQDQMNSHKIDNP